MLVSVPKPAPLSRSEFATSISQFLRRSLLSGVVEQVLRLHREAAQKLSRPLVRAERRQNIRVSRKADVQLAVALFELFVCGLRRAVITDSGGLDDKVLLRGAGQDRIVHIARRTGCPRGSRPSACRARSGRTRA